MFARSFTAAPDDIDELGHVNNAVWVRWIQDIAVEHWQGTATTDQVETYVWVIVRHEIDYRGNLRVGESIDARTWVVDAPRGAKMDRHVAFERDGKTLVEARTTWAILNRATGRIARVPVAVSARFLSSAP